MNISVLYAIQKYIQDIGEKQMENYYARALTVVAEIPYSHLWHSGGINIAFVIPHLKTSKCVEYQLAKNAVISPEIFL